MAFPSALESDFRAALVSEIRNDGEPALALGVYVLVRRSMNEDISICAKYSARALQVLTEKTGVDYRAKFFEMNAQEAELIWDNASAFQVAE